MRSQRGVTLLSLVTYIVVLLIAISSVTLVTTFLMDNMNTAQDDIGEMTELNQFELVLLNDIKQEDISIYQEVTDANSIIFESKRGTTIQYIYQDHAIYRVENETEKSKVSENIDEFKISSENNKIHLTIKVGDYEKQKEYKVGKY